MTHFDEDGDGTVTLDEVRKGMTALSAMQRGEACIEVCTEQIVQAMDARGLSSLDLMQRLDADGNGELEPAEFRQGVFRHVFRHAWTCA